MVIKSQLQLNSVIYLMRKAQKEAKRFPSKGNIATARYWEDIIDLYLESSEKDNCKAIIQLAEGAA
jgi:hypothetical protein